ncbi:transporter substrate-binding domain-containing protein [candidate division KSB1 bacterium]|nr:transporter substrate-binding domain-containing protein [candidate division KSB1 bacterium]
MNTKPTQALISFCLLIFVFGAVSESFAQGKITVGTKRAAPFAMKDENGNWHGISIELWQEIARELNLDYELREFDLTDLLANVENGSVDVGVAALTITADRETQMDFTYPFYTTGLGIAVAHEQGGWFGTAKRLFSLTLLKVIFALTLLLFAVGFVVWLFERKRNPEQFGGGLAKGIGSAFWWSAVTMTTVGYGDKAPVSVTGRLVALIWMFTGIIMISSFTAAITSALTISQLESPVQGPEDLANVRTATVVGSTSEGFLRDRRIFFQSYPTPLEGLQAVANNDIDAFIYDQPILRYLSNTHLHGRVRVLPETFEHQDYGIALPENSPLREHINRLLLETISQPQWQDILYRYLGN